MDSTTREQVEEYYGKTLESNKDLRTSACCEINTSNSRIAPILEEIEPEILDRFYGCGSPIPESIKGKTVLDLGCGTGRDVYVLSKLVGASGRVIGVDMTESQLEVATRHLETQTARFGYASPNVEFHLGIIEDLAALGIEDNSVDVVVSNCVINLSTNKKAVFEEIFRVLRPGGELYFSDVFSDRRIPDELVADPVLYGECLSGALYIEDFRRLLGKLGCPDYRVVSSNVIELRNEEVKKKVGPISFFSKTVRAFKLATLEDTCEDYGQSLCYQGTLSESPDQFVLDDHHVFPKGKAGASVW